MLATLIAIIWTDRVGRKPIVYGGFSVMAVSLAVFGYLMHVGMIGVGAHFLGIAMLLVFVIGFGCSAGPLDWTLCSEIQPLKGRDFGMGASASANWIFTGVVGATFLTLLQRLGSANTFWLYAGFNVLALLFTYAVVPETKGVMLEHIERKLMQGVRLRHIGV
jgi:SP family galactose:H+ symporter-like MFS transporter